jgi:hypothetical protein
MGLREKKVTIGNPRVDRLHFPLVELLCLGAPIFSQTHINIHYPYDLTSRKPSSHCDANARPHTDSWTAKGTRQGQQRVARPEWRCPQRLVELKYVPIKNHGIFNEISVH